MVLQLKDIMSLCLALNSIGVTKVEFTVGILEPLMNAFLETSRFLDGALEFWLRNGFSSSAGLFIERLDFDGRVIPRVPYRVMLQCRQIFVYCDAATSGRFVHGAEPAVRTLDYILARYAEDGLERGVAFSLGDDGQILDKRRDTYSHAFLLFALAAAYRLTGARSYWEAAEKIDCFMQRELSDHSLGGFFSGSNSMNLGKAQNPHMHLFEAYLFLHYARPEGPFLERARVIARLFSEKMFQQDCDLLPEYFARNWSPLPASDDGAIFEPGHHFEWIWLLAKYDVVSGGTSHELRNRLWRKSIAAGIDQNGRCFDEVNYDGQPKKRSSRLWPHCEGIKAALVMDKDPCAQVVLNRMVDGLGFFVGKPFASGWIDRFTEHSKPMVDYVPASSLYHLYLAISLFEQYEANVSP